MKFPASLFAMIALLSAFDKLQAQTNATGTNATVAGPKFTVRTYNLVGSSVLSSNQVVALGELLQPYTGTNIGFAEIKQALATIQSAYRNLGYATIGVSLPQQQLTNGVVKVAVSEGKLIDINIVGNNYFSSNNIRRALPSLETDRLINTTWFQPELDKANLNQDRQIYPVIGAGPEPNTSALTLRVKDRLPLHGRLEFNNKGSVGTAPLRIDTTLAYNNLWQQEHQVGVQYAFSPEEYKSKDATFLEQPQVANYSAFYRIPLSDMAGGTTPAESAATSFGYNELTRAVQLPSPSGTPEVTVYASRSSSEGEITVGPEQLIHASPFSDLTAHDENQSVTINENLGGRFSLPLREFASVRSVFSFGVDYKRFEQQLFTTNISTFRTFAYPQDDQGGTNGPRVVTSSETVPLGSSHEQELFYVPLSFGWSASRADKFGQTAFSYNQSVFLSAFSPPDDEVQAVAGSDKAGGTYTTINLSLSREQPLPKEWSLSVRANGQWASRPVINNEQFGIGGSGSVRGYEEGEEYGDSGWRTSLELRAPPFRDMPMPDGAARMDWRASAFVDYGERYLIDPGSRQGSVQMLGIGSSLYITVGEHFDARLTLAFSLLDTPQTKAGEGRAYFAVGAQF